MGDRIPNPGSLTQRGLLLAIGTDPSWDPLCTRPYPQGFASVVSNASSNPHVECEIFQGELV